MQYDTTHADIINLQVLRTLISYNIALESQKVLELAITYIQQHY